MGRNQRFKDRVREKTADRGWCVLLCAYRWIDRYVCLYIHVCMAIYEKLYRCKTLTRVKLREILQSSQQGQDFPHLGNTQDCFLLQVTSKRGLIYLKMTCGIPLPWRPAPGKIFQPRVPKNSPSPCTPSPCPVCCVAGSVSSTHSAYTHTHLQARRITTGYGHILYSSLISLASSFYSLTFIFFDRSALTATQQPCLESCYQLQFEDLSLTLHSNKDRVRRQGQAVQGNVAFPNSPATQQKKAGAAISTGMTAFKGVSFLLRSFCEATYESKLFLSPSRGMKPIRLITPTENW